LSSRIEREPHHMRCRWYDGPVTHAWVRALANISMGGTDHECRCGRSVRHYYGEPMVVCPNLAETERHLTETSYFQTEAPNAD